MEALQISEALIAAAYVCVLCSGCLKISSIRQAAGALSRFNKKGL